MLRWLLAWWWPIVLFVYPLLWAPWTPPSRLAMWQVHFGWLLVGLLGGLLLELLANPGTRLGDARHLPRWLRAHPPVLLALGYALWILVSSFFSPDPAAALVGSAYDQSDGVLWFAALIAMYVLVYVRVRLDPGLPPRLLQALLAAGAALAAFALVELLRGRGLWYGVARGDLPMATFPQKGHLAGFLVMAAGAAITLSRGAWPLALLLGVAIGATVNRAALAVLVAVGAIQAVRSRRVLLAAVALAGFVGGWAWITTAPQQPTTKQLGATNSIEARAYSWRAAARGIARHPVTGWGGGQFYLHWGDFLSDAELGRDLRLEYGDRELVRRFGTSYLVRLGNGEETVRYFTSWKAHNQLLDVTLMHGVVGLLCYLGLVVFALSGWREGWPFVAATLAYQGFLLLWFPTLEAEAPMWLLFAVGAALRAPARAVDPERAEDPGRLGVA